MVRQEAQTPVGDEVFIDCSQYAAFPTDSDKAFAQKKYNKPIKLYYSWNIKYNRNLVTHSHHYQSLHTQQSRHWLRDFGQEITQYWKTSDQYRHQMADQISTHTRLCDKGHQMWWKRQKRSDNSRKASLYIMLKDKEACILRCVVTLTGRQTKQWNHLDASPNINRSKWQFLAKATPEVLRKVWQKGKKWKRKKLGLTEWPPTELFSE